jgi:hypothetical protein
MKKPDYVRIVQDYIMSGEFDAPQVFSLLERLEPIFELMYDLALTEVVPERDIGAVDFEDDSSTQLGGIKLKLH